MQIKPLGSDYLVRLERGEEAVANLKHFADRYRIGFAAIHAIGTFERVTLGYYDAEAKTYRNESLDEPVEVLNLTGNIARGEDGERIVHAHVTVGRPDYTTRGGHLVEGVVGPTLEVVVETAPVTIRRRHDPDIGLALWDLEALETFSV
jgi:predicted DNA-binding protein with PD1-like motif